MAKTTITPEEASELKLLETNYIDAAHRVGEALKRHGMESREFAEADALLGKIVRCIREIKGLRPEDWGR